MNIQKKIAPAKSTGGGGYSFEDKVAAYFLFCMLSNEPPLTEKEGTITKVSFQNRAIGWLLDDILLELIKEDKVRICAISVKSSPQFNSNGMPEDFVSNVWLQAIKQEKNPYMLGQDILALATTLLPFDVRKGLNTLLNLAKNNSENLEDKLHEKGFVSETTRKMFNSFGPSEQLLNGYNTPSVLKVKLLKSLEHFEFDFENSSSDKEKHILRVCESILESGTREEAIALWAALQHIAKELRPFAGKITKRELFAKLEGSFIFKALPKYEHDWQKLKKHTNNELTTVRDRIGKELQLNRKTNVDSLNKIFGNNSVCIMLGSSGLGKSVLSKQWVESLHKDDLPVWLKASSFDVQTFEVFERNLDLKYSLADFLSNYHGGCFSLVIDGLDRLYSHEGFSNVSILINLLASNTQSFRILITCQPEEWNRVKDLLEAHNTNVSIWQNFTLKELDEEEFSIVLKTYPNLRNLSLKPALRNFLYRPKVLDLIASRTINEGKLDIAKWIGESDVIRWFWEKYITNDPAHLQKGEILKKIAEIQADKSTTEVPLSEIGTNNLEFIENNLIKDRLVKYQNTGLSFDHDSYGDWVRLQIFLDHLHKDDLTEFIKSKENFPLWNKAVRLCSVYLIEQYQDLAIWRKVINSFPTTEEKYNINQDLFLEGIIFSAYPLVILENVWPDLSADNGKLLRRLLGRFRHVATIPNPSIVKMAKELGAEYETEAATVLRIPYWVFWLPIINFLYKHKAEVIEYAPVHIAKIMDAWLRLLAWWEHQPLRKEAAEMAIENAEIVLRNKRERNTMYMDDIDAPMFRAALAGYKEFPKKLKKLIDVASGKVIVQTPVKKSKKIDAKKHSMMFSAIGYSFEDGERMKPWKIGPKVRPDDTFEEVTLNTDALYNIIDQDPKYAKEIILTLLISPPTTREYKLNSDPWEHNLELNRFHHWYPAFYNKGPFFYFLHKHPDIGLELIIELVNFAAERWADQYKEEHKVPPTVNIDIGNKLRKFYMNSNMYFWYMSFPPAPDSIAIALMSLEKWLYDQIDNKNPIDKYIKRILEKTNNVAFLGLLSAVGRKDPNLFLKLLKPLLSVFLFFIWEDDFKLQGGYWTITWSYKGEKAYKDAEQWYTMEHRNRSLTDWAKFLYLNHPDLNEFFEKNRKKWSNELKAKQIDKDRKLGLEVLIAQFDKKNYAQEEKNRNMYWQFHAPEKLQERIDQRKELNEKKTLLLNMPLYSNQFLEEGKTLDDLQAEELWKNIQQLSNLEEAILDEEKPDSKADAITGGIALLSKFNFEWLKKDPEKYKWCKEYLVNLIKNPPARAEFDSEHSVAKFHWDCFCSNALPYFWVEDQQSSELREAIALLVGSYHYTAVGILFKTCSELRTQLGDNFKCLQHFLYDVAEAKWKFFESRYLEEPAFDFDKWLISHAKKFSENKINNIIPKLSEYAIPYNADEHPLIRKRKKKMKGKAGVDTKLIQTAYQWMPLFRYADSPTERYEWIEFWHEALKHVLIEVGQKTEIHKELDGVPSPWDYWVINTVAILCVELEEKENPEKFWKPILELNTYAHYLVETFLDNFFMYAPRMHSEKDFIKTWHKMLDYAFSSSEWNLEKTDNSWTLGDFWWKLMGLDISKSNIKTEDLKNIMRASDKYLEMWATNSLPNHRCAIKFIYFLSEPVGEDYRISGLKWLHNIIGKIDTYHFWSYRSDSTEKALASLLDICWTLHKNELKKDEATFEAFKHLLGILVLRQNSIAMELHDRVFK